MMMEMRSDHFAGEDGELRINPRDFSVEVWVYKNTVHPWVSPVNYKIKN